MQTPAALPPSALALACCLRWLASGSKRLSQLLLIGSD